MNIYTKKRIAVSAEKVQWEEKALILADQLQLAYLKDTKSEAALTYDYLLLFTDDHLALHHPYQRNSNKSFYIDFLSAKMLYRIKQVSRRNELLARAIGISPVEKPFIVDGTAGLGRDSFILAALGFEVTLLERSPILYVLLQDALERAKKDFAIAPIIQRMTLIHADAIDWLQRQKNVAKPEVIYLDPMFPARQKTASVKKEMRILQDLLENNEDAPLLLSKALTCALRRVVVKRPRLAKPLTAHTPNFSIQGKSSRFDVYLV